MTRPRIRIHPDTLALLRAYCGQQGQDQDEVLFEAVTREVFRRILIKGTTEVHSGVLMKLQRRAMQLVREEAE